MDKLNLSNRKIQNMTTLKKKAAKIIKEEYRKRYYYSINYYYISKINLIFSDSKIISTIKCKYRELKYEAILKLRDYQKEMRKKKETPTDQQYEDFFYKAIGLTN